MYKIICAMPKQGIERSLPYRLDHETATAICESLNRHFFKGKEYVHRVEVAEPEPSKSNTSFKGRRSVR